MFLLSIPFLEKNLNIHRIPIAYFSYDYSYNFIKCPMYHKSSLFYMKQMQQFDVDFVFRSNTQLTTLEIDLWN